MTTWADLISNPATKKFLAAKVQIAHKINRAEEPLTTHTVQVVGGSIEVSNSWEPHDTYVFLRNLYRTFYDPDNIPQHVVRFSTNSGSGTPSNPSGHIEYTEKNSAYEVEQTPGSYCNDDGAGVTYARGHTMSFDRVILYDNSATNWLERTAAATDASGTGFAAHMHTDDEMYLLMEKSKFTVMDIKFSTQAVKGASGGLTIKYWNGSAFVDLTGNITVILGNNDLDSIDRYQAVIEWPTDVAVKEIGDAANENVGLVTGYLVQFKVVTPNYTTEGVISNISTEAVLEERGCAAWIEFGVANTTINSHNDYMFLPMIPSDTQSFETVLESNDNTLPLSGTDRPKIAGTLNICNGDGILDAPLLKKKFTGNTFYSYLETRGGFVDLYSGVSLPGQPQMLFSDFQHVGRALNRGPSRTDTGVTMNLYAIGSALAVPALIEKFTKTRYKHVDKAWLDKTIPAWFGQNNTLADDDESNETRAKRLVPGIQIRRGTDVGGGVFNATGHKACCTFTNPETGKVHGYTINNVYIQFGGTAPSGTVDPSHYEIQENGTAIRFDDHPSIEMTPGTDLVLFDIDGPLDDDLGTFTGTPGAIINNPENLIHFLWVCVLKRPSSELNIATLSYLGSDKFGGAGTLQIPEAFYDTFARYYPEQIQLSEIINALALQYFALFGPDETGKFLLHPLTVAPTNTDLSLFEEDCGGFNDELTLDYAVSEVNITYQNLPNAGTSSTSTGSKITAVVNRTSPYATINVVDEPAGVFGWNIDPLNLESGMVTQAKADALSKIIYDWLKRGPGKTVTNVIGGLGMLQLIGDITMFSRSRGIGGRLDERVTWCIRSSRNYANAGASVTAVEAGPSDFPTTMHEIIEV